jgi:hypothetical protein
MPMFNLPKSTEVKKVIPKNAFDTYTNTKQKKLFTDKILRITWKNKLSFDTVNLLGKEISEIQVFEIELKEKFDLKSLLSIIDKAIPYSIIFVIRFENLCYLSTSPKHINPNNTDTAVVDYTFNSNWIDFADNEFKLNLKNNLDWIYKDFCDQFKTIKNHTSSITELVQSQKDFDALNKEIEKLILAISKSKQFSKKVDLNLKLKDLKRKLSED